MLETELGVERLIVIPREEDDEIGHADGMVRFVDERTLLLNDYTSVDASFGQRLRHALKRQGFGTIPFPYSPVFRIPRWMKRQSAFLGPRASMSTSHTSAARSSARFSGNQTMTRLCPYWHESSPALVPFRSTVAHWRREAAC